MSFSNFELRKAFLIVGQYVEAHELLQKGSQCFTVCMFVEGSSTICQTTILYSLVIETKSSM